MWLGFDPDDRVLGPAGMIRRNVTPGESHEGAGAALDHQTFNPDHQLPENQEAHHGFFTTHTPEVQRSGGYCDD